MPLPLLVLEIPEICVFTYDTIPNTTSVEIGITDFCNTCLTNIIFATSLSYSELTGLTPLAKKDAAWLSQIDLENFVENDNYDFVMSFVSTKYASIKYPTIDSDFTQPPFMVPMNIAILYDISGSNDQPPRLFDFLKQLTSQQYLYFLTFNHNAQDVLHNGYCDHDSINSLLSKFCWIDYGGGTQDVEKEISSNETLDVILISDGNEIQNRKLLWEVLDDMKMNVIVHTIDTTSSGTFSDKLKEISCNRNGFYLNPFETDMFDLYNAFWLRSEISKNVQVSDGRYFSGESDSVQVMQELIQPFDDLFGRRLLGVVGLIYHNITNDTVQPELQVTTETDDRTIDLKQYVLRKYLGDTCDVDLSLSSEEATLVDYTLETLDDWYVSNSNEEEYLCEVDENEVLKISKCEVIGECLSSDYNNFLLKTTCSTTSLLTTILPIISFILWCL
ncbi:VWFA domain-containing protein [Entamoeba marina]